MLKDSRGGEGTHTGGGARTAMTVASKYFSGVLPYFNLVFKRNTILHF